MFDFELRWDGQSDLNAYIRRVTDGAANLTPVIKPIVDSLEKDNEEGRLAGQDKYGQALTPITSATQRGRAGTGPPLIPQGAAAKLIVGFQVTPERNGDGTYSIRGVWTGAPWLRYHMEGPDHNDRLPVRDPVGVRPVAVKIIEDIIRSHAYDIIAGKV